MVILDLSQLIYAVIFQELKSSGKDVITEDFFRHLILNTIRSYKKKFQGQYGKIIVADDGHNAWRKKHFKHYKAGRKTSRKDSDINWTEVFATIDKVKREIKENIPLKYMFMDEVEADDIIATLAFEYHDVEKILVVSSDKDFKQLQIHKNIKQYSPLTKEYITEKNPKEFLFEHILRGDPGDGIPNVLSPDDVFVDPDKKQNRLTKVKIDKAIATGTVEDFPFYNRNKLLIDLRCIPNDVKQRILEEYRDGEVADKGKLYKYMVNNQLVNLLDVIGDFE